MLLFQRRLRQSRIQVPLANLSDKKSKTCYRFSRISWLKRVKADSSKKDNGTVITSARMIQNYPKVIPLSSRLDTMKKMCCKTRTPPKISNPSNCPKSIHKASNRKKITASTETLETFKWTSNSSYKIRLRGSSDFRIGMRNIAEPWSLSTSRKSP